MSVRMSQSVAFRSNLKDACPWGEPQAIPPSQFNVPTMRSKWTQNLRICPTGYQPHYCFSLLRRHQATDLSKPSFPLTPTRFRLKQPNIHAESLLQQNENILLLYALKMGAVCSPTTLVPSTRLHGINVPDF
jgi:hypothetical protein